MGGFRGLVALGLLSLALLACVAGPAAASGTGKRVEHKVERALKERGVVRARVACRRSSTHRRYSCRWGGRQVRAGRAQSCRGRVRARVRGRRARLRWARTRCRRPAAAAPVERHPPARTTSPGTTAAPSQPDFLFGLDDNSTAQGVTTPDQSAALLETMGANSERITVDWRWVEPYRDDYRWAKNDALYAAARAHGIKPVLMLLFAPSWTLDGACNQFKQDCTYPPTRAHLADWADFVRTVVRRYPQIGGIEVWNEPNMHWFWKPGPDPALYVDLLREASTAVDAVDPATPVAGGSMANTGTTTSTDMSLIDFTRAIYARGAKSWTDAISLHPYPNSLDITRVTRNLNQVRAIRDEYGDSAKPLWVTETGLTTTGTGLAGTPFKATEAEQGWGLQQILRTLRHQPDVTVGLFHSLVESKSAWYSNPADGRDPQVGYGVVHQNLSLKPAFCSLAHDRGHPCR